MRFERRLHTLFEPGLQRALIDVAVLVRAANWTYWLSQFLVVCLVLLWIYLRRYPAYARVRNTLIVANTIGLAGYVFFPSAPPRLVPTLDIVDTLARSGSLNHATGLVQLAENPYAAMPSLHAADALIVGSAMAVLVRPPALKVLWALWPAWVSFSLMLTGNHFWIDIAAGVFLVAVSVPIVAALERGGGLTSRSPQSASVVAPMPTRDERRIIGASTKEDAMNTRAPNVWAWVVASGAFLLVIDLFFDWFKVTVDVAGVITVKASSWGWGSSWGIVAGVLALAVIVSVLTQHAAWTLACSFAMLIATGIAVFSGDANVSIPAAGVSVDTTQWAAWLGFGLAALTAAAAMVPFLKALSATPRGLEPHGTT